MVAGTKREILYSDKKGKRYTKHCGSSKEAKSCRRWINRRGFKFISETKVDCVAKKRGKHNR